MTSPEWQLDTPVALLIFNRPATTRLVFEAIRKARPKRLLVVADGPRGGREGEEALCREARSIVDTVDWECRVETNYSEENLGCKRRVTSGIDWIFEQAEEAIILEDDCLPDPSFFRFCQELLERYRDDPRVAQIAGANFQFGRGSSTDSYYFSRYNHIWGWASWSRAWQSHDPLMPGWPAFRELGRLSQLLSGRAEEAYWSEVLEKVYRGEIDTWDCQWTFSCWEQGLLTVIPSQNLISNLGFGPGATHTPVPNRYAAMGTEEMRFPLRHPTAIASDAEADAYTGRTMFQPCSFLRRLAAALRGFF